MLKPKHITDTSRIRIGKKYQDEFAAASSMTFNEFTKSSSSSSKVLKPNFTGAAFEGFNGGFRSGRPMRKNSFLSESFSESKASKSSGVSDKIRRLSKNSTNTLPSLLNKELQLSVKANKSPPMEKNENMNIFNLKNKVQDAPKSTPVPTQNIPAPEEENNDALDNISFCSEDTVEFLRDANEYVLDDDNRRKNQKLFLSEPKFHRSFQIVATARLPSLSSIIRKKEQNKDSNAPKETPGSKI